MNSSKSLGSFLQLGKDPDDDNDDDDNYNNDNSDNNEDSNVNEEEYDEDDEEEDDDDNDDDDDDDEDEDDDNDGDGNDIDEENNSDVAEKKKRKYDDSDDRSFEYSPKAKIPCLTSDEATSNDDELEVVKSKNEKNQINAEKKTSYSKSKFGEDYLLKFGYEEGRGLGKHQDGITKPVEASTQKGKRGLGFNPVPIKSSDLKYDPDLEIISLDEEIVWLKSDHLKSLDKNTLKTWLKTGPALKKTSSADSLFCEAEVIDNVLSAKTMLDSLTSKEKLTSKKKYNPFEAIGKGIFLNRGAMKMANLEAILDYMFTKPKNFNGEEILGPNDLLYFADVCAGPGGFSEYVFYRKKWRAKGFGFTLREKNDFLLEEFCAGPSETFEPYYGVREDGNIYFSENILSLRDHVFKHTDNKGVHFMMADGGTEITSNLNDQEIILKKLYLCQCLTALFLVRTEGNFVVKLFDLFSPFSAGLVYLIYRSFREVAIIKPNSSRPASSERYLVCKWKREDCRDIAEYLFEVNSLIPVVHEINQEQGVLEVVPSKVLVNDNQFHHYLFTSNVSLGKRQVFYLHKLVAFAINEDKVDERQQELRKKFLEKWNIPDAARAEPKKCDPLSKCFELLGNSFFIDSHSDIEKNKIQSFDCFKKNIVWVYSWVCSVISEESNCAFYLGLGRNNIHKYSNGKWIKWNKESNASGLCLPANTLVYAELVKECCGEGKGQRKAFAFHIIDGLFLGGEDIRNLPFEERYNSCKLFAKALYKENFPIRVKTCYKLYEIDSAWPNLVLKSIKSISSPCVCVLEDEKTFWQVGGMLFMKDVKDSWNRHFSSSWKATYFACQKDKLFEINVQKHRKKEIYADFWDSYKSRKLWKWDAGVKVHSNQHFTPDPNKMEVADLFNYVRSQIPCHQTV